MYHYLYCIENLVNGKVYVGKHSTDDMNDGYMGSGRLLDAAIKKHGIENFRKHVLATFENSEETLEAERRLVNEEFVADDNTYNLRVGGIGGRVPNWDDQVWRQKRIEEIRLQNAKLHKTGVLKSPDWTGRRHSEESKRKIGSANSTHQRGSGNSQFGTCWIHHLAKRRSQKINIDDLETSLSQGWIKGRKMKW